jgi:2-hydroxychromene-2-carboxylate isomerase
MTYLQREAGKLQVMLDVRNPLSFLALGPAGALARESIVDVDFLPMPDAPLKAPSKPAPGDARGILHRRSRANAIAREISTYAEAQGLVIRDYYRSRDPTPFHVAWLWVRQVDRARLFDFLEEGFRRYWAVDFDPSNAPEVARLVGQMSLDADAFVEWERPQGLAEAEALGQELLESGYTRGPCYVLEDEVFVGRQHLPMIRWIAAGRAGPGPI